MALENQTDNGSVPAETDDSASRSPVEFTDRELALMSGADPDRPDSQSGDDSNTPAAEPATAIAPDSAAGTSQSRPGKDAGIDAAGTDGLDATGGGTDAASVQTPKAGDSQPWYSEDHKALAASYGLTDADLAKFRDEDEFQRAATFFDKQLAASVAKDLLAQGAGGTGTGTGTGSGKAGDSASTQQAAADAAKTAAPQGTLPSPGDLNYLDPEAWRKGGADEDTIKLVAHIRDRDAELTELKKWAGEFRESQQREREEQQRVYKINSFHSIVDGLSEGRYGRTMDADGRILPLAPEHDGNRRKIFEMADILLAGIEKRAQESGQQVQPPSYQMLIRRAEAAVFAEEIAKEQQEKLRRDLTDQSRRRRPAAAHRQIGTAKAGTDTTTDEASRLANLPALKNLYDKMAEEAGAV